MTSLNRQSRKKTFSVCRRTRTIQTHSDCRNRLQSSQNLKFHSRSLSQKSLPRTTNSSNRIRTWCSRTSRSRPKYRSAHRRRSRRSRTLRTRLHRPSLGENSRKRLQTCPHIVYKSCTTRTTTMLPSRKSKSTTTRTWQKNWASRVRPQTCSLLQSDRRTDRLGRL